MKFINTITLGILLLISTFSCTKQDWDEEVNVPIRLESDMGEEVVINNNDYFYVNQAKLVVSSITISGKRIQSDDILINYDQTINLDFTNPDELNHTIKIPVGTYEELKASLTFSFDSNNSFIIGDIVSTNGQGNTKTMNIPLNFSNIESISLLNSEENAILIDENTAGLKISASIQESFNDLSNSSWQALVNANQGQSQVDLNTTIGNNFKLDINEQIKNNIHLNILN